MTHYDIATLAGTSRETASRVISQLAREGIVTTKVAASSSTCPTLREARSD